MACGRPGLRIATPAFNNAGRTVSGLTWSSATNGCRSRFAAAAPRTTPGFTKVAPLSSFARRIWLAGLWCLSAAAAARLGPLLRASAGPSLAPPAPPRPAALVPAAVVGSAPVPLLRTRRSVSSGARPRGSGGFLARRPGRPSGCSSWPPSGPAPRCLAVVWCRFAFPPLLSPDAIAGRSIDSSSGGNLNSGSVAVRRRVPI